jgi:hypothetical protein
MAARGVTGGGAAVRRREEPAWRSGLRAPRSWGTIGPCGTRTCTDGPCTKDGVAASVRLGVALPLSNRQIYDEIELDGQWYGALP